MDSINKPSVLSVIKKKSDSIHTFISNLPRKISPRYFPGYGDKLLGKDEKLMNSWNYDWPNKGDDPPPWSDWPDKTV